MTTAARPAVRFRGVCLALCAALATVLLVSCSDDQGKPTGDDAGEVLAEAKRLLDETPGFAIALSTPELPDGVSGILDASGTGTHDPAAFDGALKVKFSGITADVPVISVDGTVYAKVPPLQAQWSEIEPQDYDAPDPVGLLDPDEGISTWLVEATDVEEGDQVRDGRTVVTTYSGRLPGDAVAASIPTAVAERSFDAEFRVDDEGRVVGGTFTGPFYAQGDEVTYDLTISDYGATPEITAP